MAKLANILLTIGFFIGIPSYTFLVIECIQDGDKAIGTLLAGMGLLNLYLFVNFLKDIKDE